MRRFKIPHTLTLLFGMMVLAMVATWIVPQGFFEIISRDFNELNQ